MWEAAGDLPGHLCPIIHHKCYLGGRAAGAEERKEAKYTSLGSLHCFTPLFTPLAIETTGVLGPKSKTFVKELGGRVARVTGDQKSFHYLLQRLSVAVQRGNAASVMGTMDSQTLSLETLTYYIIYFCTNYTCSVRV